VSEFAQSLGNDIIVIAVKNNIQVSISMFFIVTKLDFIDTLREYVYAVNMLPSPSRTAKRREAGTLDSIRFTPSMRARFICGIFQFLSYVLLHKLTASITGLAKRLFHTFTTFFCHPFIPFKSKVPVFPGCQDGNAHMVATPSLIPSGDKHVIWCFLSQVGQWIASRLTSSIIP
jgi:hypothetical protein